MYTYIILVERAEPAQIAEEILEAQVNFFEMRAIMSHHQSTLCALLFRLRLRTLHINIKAVSVSLMDQEHCMLGSLIVTYITLVSFTVKVDLVEMLFDVVTLEDFETLRTLDAEIILVMIF